MDSPNLSTEELNLNSEPRRKTIAVIIGLLVFAIVLIFASVVRNETRHVELTARQGLLLEKICKATVQGC